jgi:hypothetical protein
MFFANVFRPGMGIDLFFVPDDHLKIPLLWPGQNPPAVEPGFLLCFHKTENLFFFFIPAFIFSVLWESRVAASLSRQLLPSNFTSNVTSNFNR